MSSNPYPEGTGEHLLYEIFSDTGCRCTDACSDDCMADHQGEE